MLAGHETTTNLIGTVYWLYCRTVTNWSGCRPILE